MAICPECRKEEKRRKEGACPSCGTAVNVYKGNWYRVSDGSPNVAVVEKFEELLSAKLSGGRDVPVRFRFKRKSPQYQRNLRMAETLLRDADNDLDVTREALRLLFHDKNFSYKSYTSLMMTVRDWPVSVALAVANIEQIRKGKEREKSFLNKVPALDFSFLDKRNDS